MREKSLFFSFFVRIKDRSILKTKICLNTFRSIFLFLFSKFDRRNMASVRSLNLTKPGERLLKRRLTRNSASTSKLNTNKTNSVSVTTLSRKKSGRSSSKKRSTKATSLHLRKNSSSSLNEQELNILTNEFASTSITELPSIPSARKFSIKTVETIPDETIVTPIVEPIIPAEIVEEENLNEIKIEENIPEYTVEILEPIKTIGTGWKNSSNERSKKNRSFSYLFQELSAEFCWFVID